VHGRWRRGLPCKLGRQGAEAIPDGWPEEAWLVKVHKDRKRS
jgi:hypothetical protein